MWVPASRTFQLEDYHPCFRLVDVVSQSAITTRAPDLDLRHRVHVWDIPSSLPDRHVPADWGIDFVERVTRDDIQLRKNRTTQEQTTHVQLIDELPTYLSDESCKTFPKS